jgi:hypothetical protein
MMLDLQTYSSPHFPGPSDQCPTTGDWGIELGGAAFGLDEGRAVVALELGVGIGQGRTSARDPAKSH